jgi:hypothetical protein
LPERSELETGFTRRICQRLDPPVVLETGTIKRDLLDSAFLARSAIN